MPFIIRTAASGFFLMYWSKAADVTSVIIVSPLALALALLGLPSIKAISPNKLGGSNVTKTSSPFALIFVISIFPLLTI